MNSTIYQLGADLPYIAAPTYGGITWKCKRRKNPG